MAVHPLTMAGLVPLQKQFSHVNQSTDIFRRGYLVMAIYHLTTAGLVPMPKQFSHVNQSTYVLLCHCACMQNFNMPTWDGWAY